MRDSAHIYLNSACKLLQEWSTDTAEIPSPLARYRSEGDIPFLVSITFAYIGTLITRLLTYQLRPNFDPADHKCTRSTASSRTDIRDSRQRGRMSRYVDHGIRYIQSPLSIVPNDRGKAGKSATDGIDL